MGEAKIKKNRLEMFRGRPHRFLGTLIDYPSFGCGFFSCVESGPCFYWESSIKEKVLGKGKPMKKKNLLVPVALIVALLLGLILCAVSAFAGTETCFSPFENCEDKWVEVLDAAEHDIRISCFGVTNKAIAEKLIEKHLAGVRVLVLEDKRMAASKHDLGKWLAENGIEVVVKRTTPLEHNKMAVIDNSILIMGSWNLSGNADKQDNSVVIVDRIFNAEKTEERAIKAASNALDRIYERDK
jgi:predicted DNA repair protein MutK